VSKREGTGILVESINARKQLAPTVDSIKRDRAITRGNWIGDRNT